MNLQSQRGTSNLSAGTFDLSGKTSDLGTYTSNLGVEGEKGKSLKFRICREEGESKGTDESFSKGRGSFRRG